MKLKHIKVTLFFSILLCCIFLILGFSITIEKTSAEQYSLLTLTQEDLSFQTDRDIDEFEFKTGFIEGTSVYYEVQDPEDKQYSLRPQIKTKFLNYGNCDFLITFSYFTRQIESLAHEVYVYACAYNDKDLIGSIKCFDNGLDNNTYDVGQLEYAGAFEYLIFELRVYKSTVLQNSGLYFRTDNIKIQAVSNYELESDDFEYEITEDTYYYTGEVISLAHDVTTNVDQDKYFVDIFCDREIKNIGSYQVTMSILDTAHVTVSNKVKTINVVANPIDLISVNVIRNEDFAIILDATFEDTYGYTYPLKDIDIKRIYPLNGTNTIDIKFNTTNFIKQNEDADFSASYTIRLETFDSYEAKGIYIDSINISKTYDGTIFDMNSYIKGFTEYNEDTNEITEVAAPSFAIEYFNGTEQINEIINVGEYTYSFSYGTQTILGEISILPIEIHRGNYTGTSSFDKTYDGTNIVPIDGMLGSTINPNDIELSNLLVSADVSLDAKKLEFFRTIGKTAIKVTEGELVGEDSGNYILASDFYLTNYGYISQARLAYVSNTDTAGNLMKFNEKYFNGDYDIEINYDEDVCLTLSGLGEEEVKYSQIEATLLDVNVGIVDVELTIIDYTLLGFFEEKIYMQIYPQVEILPYKLLIDNAIVSNETKTYDGTTDTNLVIESCSFSNLKDFGDGLSDILENNSKYDYVYNQAQYQTSEAGTVRINISGIIFKGFERDIQKVFNNYIIDNFVVDGHINKAPLKVEAEVIRILEGGAVSNLKLSVEGNDLVTYSIHTTKDDAINDVNYIDEANIPIGDYYLRVVCNSTNYTFIGTDYVLVQLIVKAPQEKTNQHIVINSFVYEKNITKIVIMKGGQVDLHAYSIYGSSGESDKKTNLPLTYEYSNGGSSICIVENDVLKGLNIGSAKIYISQPGDIYYNAADTIELNVEVREYSVASTINTIGDLYIPDKLPQDLSFYLLTSKINSNNVSSNIESIPDEAIKLGENDYNLLINFYENIYNYIFIN